MERIFFQVLGHRPDQRYFYVDCGAYHPFDYSVTARLSLGGWSGIAIDLSRTTERAFLRYRKNTEFILGPVGDGKPVEISLGQVRVGDAGLISSTSPASTPGVSAPNSLRISELLDARGITKVDFLNLDIEGAELAALNGIDFGRHAPTVICVEIHGVTDLHSISRNPVAKFLLEKEYLLFAATVINFFFIRKNSIPS